VTSALRDATAGVGTCTHPAIWVRGSQGGGLQLATHRRWDADLQGLGRIGIRNMENIEGTTQGALPLDWSSRAQAIR